MDIMIAHSKNKPYITQHHTPTTTSRVLSECDIPTSNYNNDEDMKSVKENFDRQTSHRFEEYEERMNVKRQKCKEQCDKEIQKIILEDKVEKSLEEKMEKGCLRCGCGLGGVAASVGIFGGIAISELKKAALIAATQAAMTESAAEGAVAGVEAGIKTVISGLQKLDISTLNGQKMETFINAQNYTNFKTIAHAINTQYDPSPCVLGGSGPSETFCTWVRANFVAPQDSPGNGASTYNSIKIGVKSIVSEAETVAQRAVEKATEEAIKASTDAVESAYAACQTAIIASVVAILVIVLVMMIIYLILRYRRKKKMNKKLQYTKLLNQ
ncbi:hypothetical protein PFNF135_04390 [Plasmodium falciparum NF135/5.C10]|uniref:Surface antigen n=1 Tax=Plasmodium falciparum NF135/5.C10 TaxID=1036726 RepID=W4IC20_PLAFA|nr:hypothetical protein PFNF135_04390 [Plasmodium falciparum NF135/5.C10]